MSETNPKKRSLFKKAAWETTPAGSPANIGNAPDVLGLSNSVFSEILYESEKKRKARKAKRQGDERVRSNTQIHDQNEENERDCKKSRVSEEMTRGLEVDELDSSKLHVKNATVGGGSECLADLACVHASTAISSCSHTTNLPLQASPSTSLFSRHEAMVKAASCNLDSRQDVVELNSDAEERDSEKITEIGTSSVTVAPNGQNLQSQDDSDTESDLEIRSIKAKARAHRRQKLEATQRLTSSPTKFSRYSPDQGKSSNTCVPVHTSPPPLQDPILRVLITSCISGSALSPLLVQRRLSQDVGTIRKTWCKMRLNRPEMESEVFLTWRNRRLYDTTTCSSLGYYVDNLGNISFKRPSKATGLRSKISKAWDDDCSMLDQEDVQVHLEAVTEDIWEQNKKNAKISLNGEVPPEFSGRKDATEPDPPPDEKSGIRIFMKAKGVPEIRIIVRPDTKFSRLAAAFQAQQKIPSGKEIFLMFDGERMDPDMVVADSEIVEMDALEVHVH